jgi:hypothetical protein
MEIVKVLGQVTPDAGILTDAYVVPALSQTTISSITVCNRSAAPTTFRISVAVAGAADNVNQYLYHDIAIPGNETFTATIGMTLQATDVIRVYAANATLSFNIFGVVTTSSSTALGFTTNKRILGRMSSGAGDPEELPFTVGTAITTLTGNQDAFDPGTARTIYCDNATLLTIRGIVAGFDGQELTFISRGAGQVDFVNQHATPVAENRLKNQVTGTISLAAGLGSVKFIYDASIQRWRVTNHDQGGWITPVFSAADYSGSSGMTWTVESGDIASFAYLLRGKTLHLSFDISGSSVGGTLSTQLIRTVPNGFVSVRQTVVPLWVSDNNSGQAGLVFIGAGSGVLLFFKAPLSNWSTSTNSTRVAGQLEIEVQ